ncbi:MAG: hypothetical protein ABIZ34_04485 [Candidatus Limnocylindrales bacterium]
MRSQRRLAAMIKRAFLPLSIAFLAVACRGGSATPSPSATPALPTPTPGASASAGPTPTATSTETASGSISHPAGGRDVVLRISVDGGLAGPQGFARNIPQITLYGDGRVITNGPVDASYPGPALPNILVARISEHGVQTILAAAQQAGLLERDHHYDLGGIFDAQTTTFFLDAAGGRHRTSAYALGLESGMGDGLPPADELEARHVLSRFQATFLDLSSWLGADVVANDLPYAFDDLRIFVTPAEAGTDPDLPTQMLTWPLAHPLAEFGEAYPMGEGVRCGTVAGVDLLTLLPRLQGSNQETRWSSDDQLYRLILRPLLPDEAGCAQS